MASAILLSLHTTWNCSNNSGGVRHQLLAGDNTSKGAKKATGYTPTKRPLSFLHPAVMPLPVLSPATWVEAFYFLKFGYAFSPILYRNYLKLAITKRPLSFLHPAVGIQQPVAFTII